LSNPVTDVLNANYPGKISDLAWIGHPRDFEIVDQLADTTNQPMRPTAWVEPLRHFSTTSIATTEGSFITMPLPLTATRVVAVPRSMAMSKEKRPRKALRGLNTGSSPRRILLHYTNRIQLALLE